jgi:hypothetical protein
MKIRLLTLLALVFTFQGAFSQAISEKDLRKNIQWLASDKRQGRATGTPQELAAAKYLAKQFRKIGLQPKGDDGTFFHRFGFKKPSDPHGGAAENAPQVYSQNVAAYLDNGAAHTIVIGAHYDHLGLGHDKNSLDPNPAGKIHNGADDNASGTAGVVELARYFAKNKVREKHNFLFLCFSGEELGLVGSKKFTDYPTVDLSKVSLMINMDMIGRLNPEKRLMVGGVGTAPRFVPLVDSLKGGLSIRLDSAGVGPSDHTSFYLKNIPVLFLFTGQHSDYHKPTDDADKVNYAGTREVLEFGIRLIEALDREPRPVFQETKAKQTDSPRFSVTLGIMPDYTFEGEGVRVDGVTDGRPASKAGVLKGDVILELGDIQVKTIQDYMKGLGRYKKGDSAALKVKRGAKVEVMEVTF